MRVASRFVASLLALLLVAQAAWAVSVCDAARAGPVVHHDMDASHHSGKPQPPEHRLPCQPTVCVTMAGCGPVALAEPAQAPTPGIAGPELQPLPQLKFLPSGLQTPEPPPPRA